MALSIQLAVGAPPLVPPAGHVAPLGFAAQVMAKLDHKYGAAYPSRPSGGVPSMRDIPPDASLAQATEEHTRVCAWLEHLKTENARSHAKEVLLKQELNKNKSLNQLRWGKDLDKWTEDAVQEHLRIADALAEATATAILSDGLLSGLEKTRLAMSRVITAKGGAQWAT